MASFISEDQIEQESIKRLLAGNQYESLHCYTENSEDLADGSDRISKKQVVLPHVMLENLSRLNPDIPSETLVAVWKDLCRTPKTLELMKVNYENYKKLKYGVQVEFKNEKGKTITKQMKLIDYETPENNQFTVVSQLWIQGDVGGFRRPDLIVYVNGFPLVFIELKKSNISVKQAYDVNLKNYIEDIPALFHYNQICVLSNGTETRLGSFLAGYEHFFEWLKTEDEKENPDRKDIKKNAISLEYLIDGLLKKETLLDYVENFILFDRKQYKLIAKNHQFLGVNNVFKAFINREELQGKLGVFWHTQGSGKSYSMVLMAKKISYKLRGNFTFLVVTDRNDLDNQIYKNFLRTEFIGEAEEVQPSNGKKLREALTTNKSILFTLIQKFRYDKGKEYPILSTRDDIIVIVDEAHRTQYKDLAENMRHGLPNAQFIAFTGTPLLGSKRLTNKWFGDYVSEYNFSESIRDNATVPLYYINAMKEVQLKNPFFDDDFLKIIEKEELTKEEQDRLENHYAKELEIIKRDDRLDKIAKHIAYHFPRRGFLGKGMVISIDKFTTVKMFDKVQRYWYEEIKDLNRKITETSDLAERTELKAIVDYMNLVEMAVVVSEEDKEEEKFLKAGLTIRSHREKMNIVDENGLDIQDNFKNPDHPLQLVFVCSMWLTGFDAPSVSTLYLDKPMKGHTLMQTIARANRVFPNKQNGIIMGYLDVFKSLKRALYDYSVSDSEDLPVKEIDTLYSQLKESIEITKSFCKDNNVDLDEIFVNDDVFNNVGLFEEYANILLAKDETRNQFRVLANTVHGIYDALKPDIFQMDFNPKEKEAILYLKGVIDGKIRPEKLEKAIGKINELLDVSVLAQNDSEVESKGTELVISTSIPIDLSKLDIDELEKQFKKVKHKNLVIADLRELLESKLALMTKQNVTRGHFSDRFRQIIEEYNAGGSLNDSFYQKLLQFMKDLQDEEARHIKEELSEVELELFDLLLKDKLNKDEEKRVKLAAKELFKTLTKNKEELFVVGWEKDNQPQEKVKTEIKSILNEFLPESYDREIFSNKTDVIFEHILDQARMGFNWVA